MQPLSKEEREKVRNFNKFATNKELDRYDTLLSKSMRGLSNKENAELHKLTLKFTNPNYKPTLLERVLILFRE